MVGIKTKSLLGLLLISLLLPTVLFGRVIANYGAGDNIRSGLGRTTINLNTPVNGRSPADRLIKQNAPQVNEQLVVGNRWQIPERVRQILSSILARLRAIFDPAPVNSPPVAEAQTLETTTNQPIEITLSGSDPDTGNTLTYQVSLGPENGVLSGTPPVVTYTPNPGFIGQDSFTYVVNDGQLGSSEARVDITVEFSLMMERLNPDNIDEWGDTGIEGSFGRKVDINGDVAIVAIPDYYEYTDEFDALNSSGAAQIYRYDGNVWQVEALLPPPDMYIYEFGSAVAINGDIAAVGVTDYWLWDDDYGEYATSGAVYIYRYNHATGKWQMEERLVPSNPNWLDLFGASIEINGDRIIVGAPNAYNNTGDVDSDYGGAAFVFKYGYDSLIRTIHWFEEGKLVAPQYTLGVNYLGDDFGISVSMRGNLAVVGARLHDNNTVDKSLFAIGAVYLYKYDPTAGWTFDTKLHAGLDVANVQNPGFFENDGDFFGNQVAFGDDVLVVGANSILTNELSGVYKDGRGAVYIYKRNPDGTWGPDFTQKLVNSSAPDSYDEFGLSLDIDLLNNLVVSNTFEISHQADDLIYQNGEDYMGATYIYQPDQSGTWTQLKIISPDVSEMTINDIFGSSVAVDGGRYIIGTDYQEVCFVDGGEGCFENYEDIEAGSAYIYIPTETRLAFNSGHERVPPGGSFTLNWDSSNATSITIKEKVVASDNSVLVDDHDIFGPSNTFPGNLRFVLASYPLNAVATYTATATGPKGTAIKTVSVTVGYSEPIIEFFIASPTDPEYPDANAILSWNVINADSTYGGTVDIDQGVGVGLAVSGSMPVSVASNTTYTLTASNPGYINESAVSTQIEIVLPANLVLTNNPAAVAGNDVTISWEPNGTASALYLQELDGNSDVVLETLVTNDPVNTTSYTFTPDPTRTYRLRFSSDSGSIFQNITITIIDPASLGIAILTPPAGGVINKPFTNVTGLVTTGEDEVGVIVNGVIAIVDGNEFFANNVPLAEGINSIEAIATEPNGSYVTYALDVTVDTIGKEWVLLDLYPDTGTIDIGATPLVPFTTTLKADLYLLNAATSSSVD